MWAAVWVTAPVAGFAQVVPSIRRVQVLHSSGQVEIEIEASGRIVPQTNLLTGPDRLLVDFVNAIPGAELRNQAVNRSEVKSLRVGLFSSDPPVTRIVLDLNGPQPYQVFPSGRTIIIKIGTPGTEATRVNHVPGPGLVNAAYPVQPALISVAAPVTPAAKPALVVSFHDGLLSISSNQASLSEVLFAVHQRTGAEIAIPAGAEEERVAVNLGPAPAPEVLAHLLNGSKFNFLILSSASNPRAVDQVILSPRAEGAMQAQTAGPQPGQAGIDDNGDPGPQPQTAVQPAPPPPENPNPNSNQAPPPPPQINDVPD
ncbi:MAG: AMIN domain-containing protein [Candidatus Sulfotelmatobacter sp.]